MPQDIRSSPDGKRFYIADMHADGVHVVDGESFKEVGFIATGLGAHGLYPSRDGKSLYVANRGSHKIHGPKKGNGGVTVIDFATEKVVARWPVPGGGSPDMGNVSADGKWLWLAGALRRRDLSLRYRKRRRRPGEGRRRAAWPDGLAAAGALFARAHGEPPIARRRVAMNTLLDSFWRAVAYCLHPRVIALSLLPLALIVAAALGLGYFFWDSALDAVRSAFESLGDRRDAPRLARERRHVRAQDARSRPSSSCSSRRR